MKPGTDLSRARAFGQLATRFTSLYDFGIWLLPIWGGRLRKALEYLTGPRVLEVSFGTGYLMSRYAGRFETTGLDESQNMIRAAERRLRARGLNANLVRGDAHALPFPEASFDCLLNTDAFTLYQDPPRAMGEFFRVLVPGGRLLLMEWNPPKDGNRLGKMAAFLTKLVSMPRLDMDGILSRAGFVYEDVPVGLFGVLHLYVATKPKDAPHLTASGTT